MRRRIGYFIRLTFEGDVTKPVTFSKQQKYTKLPQFFRIKMFAPYFYNPAQNRKVKPTQRRGLSPVTAAYNLSDQVVSLPTPQELCTFAQSLTEPELLQLGAQLAVNRMEWRSICRQASSADREEAKRLIATDYSRNYRDLAQRVDRFTKLISSWQGQWAVKNAGRQPAEHDHYTDLLRVPNDQPRGSRPYFTDQLGQYRPHLLTADRPILIPPTYSYLEEIGGQLQKLLEALPQRHRPESHAKLLRELGQKLTGQSLGCHRPQILLTSLPALLPSRSDTPNAQQGENLLQQFLSQVSPPERYID
ncbi:hypothetical protein FAUST_862 [Fusarium austroamericanum]|uniref:Uncharacterized protein n=1 Tax=Fusarium austroamericanum TaxID=282268 RepID=A0AAN6C9M4_FUSAU|nr:hypothetical protein FAUST_862 [Fusarium austroamericanum]